MIRSFEIRNFKSILDLRIDLTFNEGKAPPRTSESETLPFLETGDAKINRYTPVLAIYGANASGKSNLVEAFQCFCTLLRQGVANNLYKPNKLNRKYNSCTFKITLEIKKRRLVYEMVYDANRILLEALSEQSASAQRPPKTLFRIENGGPEPEIDVDAVASAAYPAQRLKEAVRVECSNADGNMTRPFLWCLVRSFGGLFPLASDVWKEIQERLHIFNRNEFFLSQGVDLLAGSDSDEERNKAIEKIVVLLKKFDFGIQNISLSRQHLPKADFKLPREGGDFLPAEGCIYKDDEKTILVDEFTSRHLDTNGQLVPFKFMLEESDGTKVIAGLLGIALWALENGKTIIIDELDRSLHPFVLISLIRLFKSRRYNQSNAQIIFTLHDPTLLDEHHMRISEVAIVNKTLKGGTTCKRICDFEGARNVSNFRKQYLEGVFSGIPYPYI